MGGPLLELVYACIDLLDNCCLPAWRSELAPRELELTVLPIRPEIRRYAAIQKGRGQVPSLHRGLLAKGTSEGDTRRSTNPLLTRNLNRQSFSASHDDFPINLILGPSTSLVGQGERHTLRL